MSSVSLLKHGWEAPDRSATRRFYNNHNCNCTLVTVRWVAKPLGVFVVQAERKNGKLRGNSLRRRKRAKESGLEKEEATGMDREDGGRKWRRFLTGSISFYDFASLSPTHMHALFLSLFTIFSLKRSRKRIPRLFRDASRNAFSEYRIGIAHFQY